MEHEEEIGSRKKGPLHILANVKFEVCAGACVCGVCRKDYYIYVCFVCVHWPHAMWRSVAMSAFSILSIFQFSVREYLFQFQSESMTKIVATAAVLKSYLIGFWLFERCTYAHPGFRCRWIWAYLVKKSERSNWTACQIKALTNNNANLKEARAREKQAKMKNHRVFFCIFFRLFIFFSFVCLLYLNHSFHLIYFLQYLDLRVFMSVLFRSSLSLSLSFLLFVKYGPMNMKSIALWKKSLTLTNQHRSQLLFYQNMRLRSTSIVMVTSVCSRQSHRNVLLCKKNRSFQSNWIFAWNGIISLKSILFSLTCTKFSSFFCHSIC